MAAKKTRRSMQKDKESVEKRGNVGAFGKKSEKMSMKRKKKMRSKSKRG